MDQKQQIKNYCRQFKITGISTSIDQLIATAEKENASYLDFVIRLLDVETKHRQHNEFERRQKAAQLPLNSDLDTYNHAVQNGLSRTQFNQLRELTWVDQIYNLMLMGPSGTGKTFLAAGLCADAINKGFKAYFRTMDEIMHMLKLKDVTRSAAKEHKRLCKANLIVIEDIMLFPIERTWRLHFSTLSIRSMKPHRLLSLPTKCPPNGRRRWTMKSLLQLSWIGYCSDLRS